MYGSCFKCRAILSNRSGSTSRSEYSGAHPESSLIFSNLSTLPTSDEILTPLQWNDTELSILDGLNLGHAVRTRRELWRREWEETVSLLGDASGVELDW
jgi:hypothetical protein